MEEEQDTLGVKTGSSRISPPSDCARKWRPLSPKTPCSWRGQESPSEKP